MKLELYTYKMGACQHYYVITINDAVSVDSSKNGKEHYPTDIQAAVAACDYVMTHLGVEL